MLNLHRAHRSAAPYFWIANCKQHIVRKQHEMLTRLSKLKSAQTNILELLKHGLKPHAFENPCLTTTFQTCFVPTCLTWFGHDSKLIWPWDPNCAAPCCFWKSICLTAFCQTCFNMFDLIWTWFDQTSTWGSELFGSGVFSCFFKFSTAMFQTHVFQHFRPDLELIRPEFDPLGSSRGH